MKVTENNKLIKFTNQEILDFKNIKIGIYGIGEIGKVVAKDLTLLGLMFRLE